MHADASGSLDALIDLLGRDRVVTDLEERRAYSADLYAEGACCAAVIRPADRGQLGAAVAAAGAAGFAVIPRGAGLTYTGGYTPEHSRTVIVDLAGLDRIVALSEEDLYVTVETGCTWKQIHAALAAKGLRLPCFGTFSGARATVGGGLSGGALFFGTARYGTVADSLLGLEVVLADGSVVRTGQGAVRNVQKPAYRTYGPDLTGLFVHDSGALGIKSLATFRLIRAPAHTGYASFVFRSMERAAAALSEVARAELAEDAYVFDPAATRRNLSAADLGRGLRTLARVVRGSGSVIGGLKAASRMAAAGRRFIEDDVYSLHVTCAARSAAALAADLEATRRIAARFGGAGIADSIPRAVRADPFPPVNGVVDADGRRWAALNAKVAHSDAGRLIERAEAVLARRAGQMQACGVSVSRLMIAISSHAFSYEPVFHWADAWLPMHRRTPEPRHLGTLQEPAANPAARALVHEMRSELLELFRELGAASNQIGRTYPYLDALDPRTRTLLERIKRAVDPRNAMNPGALGLRP